jgi:hypothetical protein
MKWIKSNCLNGKNFKDNSLEFAEGNGYRAQAMIIKKEQIFTEKLFGDFDIAIQVFDLNWNQIDEKKIEGMNGNKEGALKQLNKLKQKVETEYLVK